MTKKELNDIMTIKQEYHDKSVYYHNIGAEYECAFASAKFWALVEALELCGHYEYYNPDDHKEVWKPYTRAVLDRIHREQQEVS